MQQLDDFTKQKQGFKKIRFACEQSKRDGLQWTWVDTCCIDKINNNTELAETINSMFRWYRDATRCYVYLSDVSTTSRERELNAELSTPPWESAFRVSRWFTKLHFMIRELMNRNNQCDHAMLLPSRFIKTSLILLMAASHAFQSRIPPYLSRLLHARRLCCCRRSSCLYPLCLRALQPLQQPSKKYPLSRENGTLVVCASSPQFINKCLMPSLHSSLLP